jgi:serine/threonine-protein kinase
LAATTETGVFRYLRQAEIILAAAQQESVFSAGERVGGYTVLSKLGEGGMGEVYLAEHRRIARKAAIKVLRAELSHNEQIVARFFTEARAASLIRHPGIVEILDCDVHPNGRAYIVMDYLEGEGLEDCVARAGSLNGDPALLASILGQIADALAAAHAAGIVHRDLKPANIFLAVDPSMPGSVRVKVLDFGIAKLAASEGVTRTQTGSLLGTPLYMSPEQCRGAGLVDHRADIYALGCIAFELVAGRPPFLREGAGDLIVAHVSEEPPPLSSLVPSVSAAFERLVAKMLAKDASQRPQTMKEVGQLVRAALLDRPAAATAALPPAATAALPPAEALARTKVLPGKQTTLSDTASELSSLPASPPRARRWTALVGGGLAVLAGVALAVTVLRRPQHPGSGPTSASSPAAPTPVAAPPPPAEAPAPATVSIAIASSPAGAQVWVDDEPSARGQTPLSVSLAKGKSHRTVRLTLEGYLPKTLSVGTDRDNAVAVALDAAPAKATVRPRPKKTKATPRPRPSDDYRKLDE